MQRAGVLDHQHLPVVGDVQLFKRPDDLDPKACRPELAVAPYGRALVHECRATVGQVETDGHLGESLARPVVEAEEPAKPDRNVVEVEIDPFDETRVADSEMEQLVLRPELDAHGYHASEERLAVPGADALRAGGSVGGESGHDGRDPSDH